MRVGREDDGAVRLRGRLRFVEFAAFLVGGVGFAGLGIAYLTQSEDTLGGAFFVVFGTFLIAAALLTFRREVVANDDGVTVVNSFRRYPIPWTDLADIGFHRVDSAAIRGMFYTLVFYRLDGSLVKAEVPGGRAGPEQYLDTIRTHLLAWRDAIIDDASA